MTRAYNELYVEDAQRSLAAMLDYAVNCLKYELRFFYDMFLQSTYCERFEEGDAAVLSGMSGVELARKVVEEHTDKPCTVEAQYDMERSPAYWTGWVLAYYQWYRSSDFKTMNREAPIQDIYALYTPYHEMDILQFVDKVDEWRMQRRCMTYLKLLRQEAGLSQRELSELTDIPIKTIQQYEQRQKNINKAQVEYVIRLSHALNCRPQDLLEQ